ncbi:junctional adhesion molecule B-like [Arapaima gigas]
MWKLQMMKASRDPNSDPYTSLDVQNRSSDYDTLTVVNRAARHTNTEFQTSAQTPNTSVSLDAQNRSSDYENLMPGLIFKRKEEQSVIFVFIVA